MAGHNMSFVTVPNNMTHLFQPLDITVNKVAKNIVREGYSTYYSNTVQAQLRRGIRPVDVKVDLKILTLKPLHARWIENIFEAMQDKADIIVKGFEKAGILAALDYDYLIATDPFIDVDDL